MASTRKVKVLWGTIVLLFASNAWTLWQYFSVKEEYRRELVAVIQDAYQRGAYPPDHPFYETARQIERLKQLFQDEKPNDE